jgi:hypothetical protein
MLFGRNLKRQPNIRNSVVQNGLNESCSSDCLEEQLFLYCRVNATLVTLQKLFEAIDRQSGHRSMPVVDQRCQWSIGDLYHSKLDVRCRCSLSMFNVKSIPLPLVTSCAHAHQRLNNRVWCPYVYIRIYIYISEYGSSLYVGLTHIRHCFLRSSKIAVHPET